MINIYCDGGSSKLGNNRAILSWGIRIEGSSGTAELMGARRVKEVQCHYHEITAFVEAVIWCKKHNGNTLNTRFFTDSREIVDHTDYRITRFTGNPYALSKHLTAAFKNLELFYDKQDLALAQQFLHFAEINWVKGHKDCVNNNRADYLASCARRQLEGIGDAGGIAPYSSWLKHGRTVFDKEGKSSIVYPPFVKPADRSVLPAETML